MPAAVDHVGFQARLQPHRLAFAELFSERRWTYAQFDAAIGRSATVLADMYRVRAGDRVASLGRNRAELILLHLACARLGAIYVPLNWRLSGTELAVLVKDADPVILLGDTELDRADLQNQRQQQGAPALCRLEDFAALCDDAQPMAERPIDDNAASLILYTSGTSGRPKGVLLSERNLAQTAINFGRLGRVTDRSVFLTDSPMFHIIGLVTCIRPAFLHGGATLATGGFDPARTLAFMADPSLAVTHYFCVPQMAAKLRDQTQFDPAALHRLTAIFTGGAPHPADLIRAWLDDGVSVVDGYGMSEAGTVFGMPIDRQCIAARMGSCGIAPPSLSTRIVNDAEEDCEDMVPGELLLKGESIFKGYWRRPQETQAAFAPGGWFRTGDIALRDAAGFHYLVDRKKDMFISGGENIYPAEIEAAVAGHPQVAECAVIGVPDARWGEVGHLVLVPASGQTLETTSVLARIETRLARYKLPKHVTILQALPRNGAGKVVKAELRRLLGVS
jgi:fatty-acyl-CoA synthase